MNLIKGSDGLDLRGRGNSQKFLGVMKNEK